MCNYTKVDPNPRDNSGESIHMEVRLTLALDPSYPYPRVFSVSVMNGLLTFLTWK